MQPELIKELWTKLDKLRGSQLDSSEQLSSLLQEISATVPSGDLPRVTNFLLSKLGFRGGGMHYVPEWLMGVFTELVKTIQPRTVCDPWAGLGVLVGTLQEAIHAGQGFAFTSNQSDAVLGRTLVKSVQWQVGDPLLLLDALEIELDLAVSILPFGAKPNRPLILTSMHGERVELRDDLGPMILASAACHLSRDGFGLFVVTPSFFFSQRSVLRHFGELGLGIEAALALPAGSFAPFTSIPAYLVIIRRRPVPRMFVAQLSSDHNTNLQILSNFKGASEGGSLELGRFVRPDSFKGLNSIRSAERFEQAAQHFGTQAVRLGDLATTITLGRFGETFEFTDQENSIFIPIIGVSDVVDSVDDLRLKAQNYAQVTIDPARSAAGFVAKFLNSEFGKEIREGSMAGAVIPKLNKQSLMDLRVLIPDLQTQNMMLELEGKVLAEQNILLGLQSEISALRRELWGNPKAALKISHQVQALSERLSGGLNQYAVQSLDQWFETLPFPLASILRAWQATPSQDFKTKHEHLLHFFEATAEFLSVILLSAFGSKEAFFEEYKKNLSDALEKQKLSFQRATFGTWKLVVENLGKRVRQMLSGDKDARALCAELFQDPSLPLAEMVSSKELLEILSRTNKMRNDWAGHSGVVGQDEAKIRNEQLLEEVQKFRALTGDLWLETQLIRGLHCRPRHGMFENEIAIMMGSNSEFLKEARQMNNWLDVEHLYLSRKDASGSLRLLPLIQVGPSPQSAKNACYFFNRLEKDGVRFISYHFTDQPELKGPFDEALKTIRFLTER